MSFINSTFSVKSAIQSKFIERISIIALSEKASCFNSTCGQPRTDLRGLQRALEAAVRLFVNLANNTTDIFILKLPVKGTVQTNKTNLYYSFDSDENLYTFVELKIKSNRVTVMNFFSIFFIENELFTENVKKGVRSNEPNDRRVQHTQLTYQSKPNFVLNKIIEVFLLNFILVFKL